MENGTMDQSRLELSYTNICLTRPKSSRYLPVLDESLRSTPLSSTDQSRGKEAKIKALQNTKRRATMNSRVAYDEDEMLRRAIEESKADGTLGKRGREDSEEYAGPKP